MMPISNHCEELTMLSRTSKPELEHRHYKAIARIIAMLPTPQRREIAEHFSFELRGTNPNFDRDRFYNAAMGNPSNGRDKR
jgi:hypothetical protein